MLVCISIGSQILKERMSRDEETKVISLLIFKKQVLAYSDFFAQYITGCWSGVSEYITRFARVIQ